MAQRESRPVEFVDVRIPVALADRIDDVYAECRGYEPSSMQESLSVLCDVAAGRLDLPDDSSHDRTADRATGAADRATGAAGDAPVDASPALSGSVDDGDDLDDLDPDRRANVDAAFPTRWSSDPDVARTLAAVVDRYVENPAGLDDDEREADALHAVGEREGLAPDELRERLVTSLYGNTGLPDDLAGEFFSDALASVADAESTGDESPDDASVDDRLDVPDSPIFDDGPPALADGPPAEPAQPAAGLDPEAAFDSPTDEVTVDSLLADEAAPTARCERCEAYHRVDDLETVIGSASATIELLCGSCAADVEKNC